MPYDDSYYALWSSPQAFCSPVPWYVPPWDVRTWYPKLKIGVLISFFPLIKSFVFSASKKHTRRLPSTSLPPLKPLTESECEMSNHDIITKIYLFSPLMFVVLYCKLIFRCGSISGTYPCIKVSQWVGGIIFQNLGPSTKHWRSTKFSSVLMVMWRASSCHQMSSMKVLKSKSPGGIEGWRLVRRASRMSKKFTIWVNGLKPSSDIESISCPDIMSRHQRAQRWGTESMDLTLNWPGTL